jgi:serine/threonine protein kinase
LVLGPFQVLAPIGKGGMGTVYLARDSRNGQLAALKVLSPRRAREEPRLLARFRREMELSQTVAHPHVAWTYEVGVHKSVYFIAMEYIPGRSLYRVVADEGPLAVPRAARLFAELATGLEHTHRQGLIHRDVKPSNVIVTPHDHVKLLDLGLALRVGEAGQGVEKEVVGGQGYIVGSMDYIAPEQTANASRVDVRADIYGLGCSLYYVLTGQPPFPGGTAFEKIQKHRNDEPPYLSDLNPTVPVGFASLVRKMMAKRPDKRYTTAAQVRDELLPWSKGEIVLPLDRPDDQEYRAAVEVLNLQEEASAEVIAVDEEEEVGDSTPKDAGHKQAVTETPGQPSDWILYFVLGGAAALFFLVMACAGLLYLILRR